MNRRTLTILILAIIALLLSSLTLTIGLLIGGNRGGAYELALRLYEEGEYERAKMLIDVFLLDKPRNSRGRALQERIEGRLADDGIDSGGVARPLPPAPSSLPGAPPPDVAGDVAGDVASGVAGAPLDSGTPFDSRAPLDSRAQRTDAEQRLSEVSRRDADSAQNIERLLTEGSQLLSRNQTEEARAKFERVLAIRLTDKKKSDAYDSIALARTADAFRVDARRDPQQYAVALKHIAEAKVLDGNNWESYYVEGLIAADRNRLDDAINAFTTADRLKGDNPDVLFALANAQYRQESFDSADSNYRRVLALVPNYRNAHHNLGVTLVRKGEGTAARKVFEQGVGHYANDHRLNYRLGIANFDAGRLNDAEQYLRVAVRQNPQNATYYGKLGDLYYNALNITGAKEAYRRAIQLAPENAALQYNMAVVHNIAHEYAAGKRAIDIALRSDPRSAPYQYTHGQILDGLGRRTEAQAAFQTALTIDRNYPEAMSELGRLHIEGGDLDVGLRFLERAYALKPNSPEVNNTIGNAYLALQDYAQAITHFTNAVNLRPNDNRFRYNVSLAHIELKQYTKALVQLRTVLDADSSYWDVYLKIGVVHIARGEKEQARSILTELARRNPSYRDIDEVNRILNNIL